MPHLQLSLLLRGDQAEVVAEKLLELGAVSVSFQSAAQETIFHTTLNETPLWQKTQATALFRVETDMQTIVHALKTSVLLKPHVKYEITLIEDQDWVRLTQQNFPPQYFISGKDKLWIIPSFYNADDYQGIKVRLDPGLAFGTGTHPTTRLCLNWLAQRPPQNLTVIDYGCGSGILALAALALGAKKVYAIDHDPQALMAVNNNAALNSFVTPQNLTIISSAEVTDIKAPLILANILGNTLVELSPKIQALAAPHATLVLSGLLMDEINKVKTAYQPYFSLPTLNAITTEEEWVRMVLQDREKIRI